MARKRASNSGSNSSLSIESEKTTFSHAAVSGNAIAPSQELPQLRELLENSPISFWQLDWSPIRSLIDRLHQVGVSDVGVFLSKRLDQLGLAIEQIRVTDANAATFQLFHAPSLADLSASLGVIFDPQTFLPIVLANLEGDSYYSGELSLRSATGDPITVKTCLQFPPSPDQFTVGVTMTDLTLQRRAEKERSILRDSWERVTRVAKVGTWSYDFRTDEPDCSDQVARIHEFDPADRGVLRSIMDDYVGASHRAIQRAFDEGRDLAVPFDLELEIRTRKGNPRWVHVMGVPVTEGKVVVRLEGVLQDVTDRKLAEDSMVLEQRLLDRMSRLAKVGGWSFDVKIMAGAWTEEIARIHDIEPSDYTTVRAGVSFFEGEYRSKIESAIKDAIEKAEPYDLELEIVSAKKVRKWVRTLGYPILEDGKVVRVEGAMQDITDRKNAEAVINKSRAQLGQFVTLAPHAICMLDREMRYIATSKRWVENYGRGHLDVVGRSHYEIHPNLPSDSVENHKRAMAGEFLRKDEDRWTYVDGTEQWLRWAMFPWRDENDEIGGIIISADDITQIKQDEMEIRRLNMSLEQLVTKRTVQLEQARRDLESILDGIPTMVGYWDRNERNRFANHAYLDWFGVAPEKVKGMPLADLLGPDLYRLTRPYVDGALRGETQVFERVIPYPDGSRYRHSMTHYIPDIHGEEVQGFYVLAYDVTQVKNVESALRMANQELEAFSYAVAHDLRAPLRAMSGFSHALINDYGADLKPEAQGYLKQIIGASRKMADLIDGLLALSRSTQSQLRYQHVDLSEVAHSVRHQLTEISPERDIDWQIEPNLTAFGDPSMLETVVRNLIENAWKYTSKTPHAIIRLYADSSSGIKHYLVVDNGAGFDPAYADRLFQPFQRLHRQDEFSGIGIGLATVHRIVHRHGGQIRATSAVGQGATFCFTLGAKVEPGTS